MRIADTPIPPASVTPDSQAGAAITLRARAYPRGLQLGTHVHREAQLLFAASGVMQVDTPTGRWLVPPQRAVWLPPRIEHAVDMLADVEMRSVYIAPEWLVAHPEAPRLGREFVVAVGPLLREAILGAFRPDVAGARVDLLVTLAVFELAEAEDAATFVPLPTDPRARKVAQLVLADPAGQRELEDLAREAGASARTITRLFPAETELTFKAWRQRARVLAAVEALGSGRATVKQIGARLGFSSVAAFGHAFKGVTGITPSELLRRSRPSR